MDRSYRYWAIDHEGRRVRGVVVGRDERAAFDRLSRDGMQPLRLKPERQRSILARPRGLSEPELSKILHELGALLAAGVDMKTALSLLSERGDKGTTSAALKKISASVSGGAPLDTAFSAEFGRQAEFVGGLVAAGQASGDLAGGMTRAAKFIDDGLELRRRLVEALSYPAFVGTLALAALMIILLVVIPALAPLLHEGGSDGPIYMALLLNLSELLLRHIRLIVTGIALSLVAATIAWRMGLLQSLLDRIWLHGPLRRTASQLIYGSFAITLGGLLSSGVGMSEALRLAQRSVRSTSARAKMDTVSRVVREGRVLSDALGRTPGFPHGITRLARIGEEGGALGVMLERAGRLEREQAYQSVERATRWLGPGLIILLGGLIGLLMAGLLSGVSQLGEAALS